MRSALLTAGAIRTHCNEVAREVVAGRSPHLRWHEERLPRVASYVVDVVRERYPDLRVPFHSRWRHFEAGGIDRWGALAAKRGWRGIERARAAVDLVIPSVLLDAGAGPDWRFHEAATGQVHARSEGLGIASLELFATGALTGEALAGITAGEIARAFQVRPDNPLVGLEGRAALIAAVGRRLRGREHLVDAWLAQARGGRIAASTLLETLLDVLPMRDCWPHPAATGGWVPFHKLTQWLTYSLPEPLADAGLQVTGLDQLTGLPEYRNGGLLLDLGLIEPRDGAFLARTLTVEEPAVVEWRALTVVALDRLAPLVRDSLGVSERDFPLARLLEGGTWAAGRKIAAERRPGGAPPVRVASDGTVF